MRSTLFICVAVLLVSLQGSPVLSESTVISPVNRVLAQAALIEQDLDARVGLFVRDVDTGVLITHAADERFPLNSTFKLFACAAILARVDAGITQLEEQLELDAQEPVAWSPVVEKMLESGIYRLMASRSALASRKLG